MNTLQAIALICAATSLGLALWALRLILQSRVSLRRADRLLAELDEWQTGRRRSGIRPINYSDMTATEVIDRAAPGEKAI